MKPIDKIDIACKNLTTGLILSGGRSRRMGGQDKGLLLLENKPMIEWSLLRFSSQVSKVVISANRNTEQYASFGYSVVADDIPDFRGPLAGVAAGLSQSHTPWLMSIPCDSPLIPDDLVSRFYDQAISYGFKASAAYDGRRLQPAFMFIHRCLLMDLNIYLDTVGRKIDRWLERQNFRTVDF